MDRLRPKAATGSGGGLMRCIFCDIVGGRAKADRIYEDEDILAFLDINPVNPGHALVIPKGHYETFLDIPDRLMGPLGVATRRVSAALMQVTKVGGFNLMMNNYRVANQLVPHAHFHVVPRREGDGLRHWPGVRATAPELASMAERLRAALT
jgi:histidine triad (HIT) family protein